MESILQNKRVKKVLYLKGYKLLLTFYDRKQKVIDVEPFLKGEVFEPLKDIEYFKKVKIHKELHTIYWPNGADFCPDVLYEIGIECQKSA